MASTATPAQPRRRRRASPSPLAPPPDVALLPVENQMLLTLGIMTASLLQVSRGVPC